MLSKQIPWPRILVEGLVIIASILLALAADAWWEARRDRGEELRVLSDLHDEFLDHRMELGQQIESNGRKRSAAEDLLFWMAREREFDRQSLDSLWGEMVTTTGFDPATGVYEATVASGQLELVQSRQVRNAISNWPHVLDEVSNSESGVREVVLNALVPALVAAGAPLTGTLAEAGYSWSAPIPDDTRAMSQFRRVRDSGEVESLLAYRYSWTTGLADDLAYASGVVEELLTLLEGELNGRAANAS